MAATNSSVCAIDDTHCAVVLFAGGGVCGTTLTTPSRNPNSYRRNSEAMFVGSVKIPSCTKFNVHLVCGLVGASQPRHGVVRGCGGKPYTSTSSLCGRFAMFRYRRIYCLYGIMEPKCSSRRLQRLPHKRRMSHDLPKWMLSFLRRLW